MASPATEDPPPPTYTDTVEEISRIYKQLPPRPSIEEVEAAISVLQTVEAEQNLQLEEISKQQTPPEVPPELFSVLQEVKRTMVSFRSHDQRKEAAQLVETDRIFQVFDGLIQKASSLVSGKPLSEIVPFDSDVETEIAISEKKSEDGAKIGADLKGFGPASSSSKLVGSTSGVKDEEKLNLMKVAALIENSAKTGATILDLQGKLMDKVEWLPLSLGKLTTLSELYLSENRIMALPPSIGSLITLTKLDIRSNQIINLPPSFGELQNLTDLDLSANLLKSLPESFANLTNLINLDLSTNRFSKLPGAVGYLISLQRLNVETNNLEELFHGIGFCSSLLELRLDFNQLKNLPESIGKLECLEILTLHYNRVKKLPISIGNLLKLRELDVSFNELEIIPETLCSAVNLVKLNLGKNFADLRMLPQSIGNLVMLEDLDISYNQIKNLPDSFGSLSKLRHFRADQTPLEVPPKEITKLGAQDVVKYMVDFVAEKEGKFRLAKRKRGFCSYICPLLCFGIGNK
ncbi:hypothetical protein ACP275_10G127100 [Erythranthe tilingii]